MVKQHLYRVGRDGGRTVAVSEGMKDSAWLPLLEQQLSLMDSSSLTAPAYDQYPLGFGLVLSCRTPDPFGWEGGCLYHQMIFDDPMDVEELMASRPLPESIFASRYREKGPQTELLADIPLHDLLSGEETARCFHALDQLFGRDETLLARFISALIFCARDRRQGIRAAVSEPAEKLSPAARRVMELIMHYIPMADASKLSFCTLKPADEPILTGTVSFTPDDGRVTHLSTQDILFDLTARQVTLPVGVTLPDENQYIALARMLMHHEANPASGVQTAVSPSPVKMEAAPFEEGMSLEKYFSDWRAALETRRPLLTAEAFRAFVSEEWQGMLSATVAASELMDNAEFLAQLTDILSVIRREKPESMIAPDDDTLSDLITLLLDSIRWRQINLADGRITRLMRTVTAYAQVLTEAHCGEDCLIACRIVYRLLTSPVAIHESLREMARLEEISSACFEALQDCLRQYVQHRLTADPGAADEALAAAAMLAFARFADGVPDLRLADKLVERIEAQSGVKAALRFQGMMDRLRRHLHSVRPGMLHRRDVKLILIICCILLAIIAGISAWFFLLNQP